MYIDFLPGVCGGGGGGLEFVDYQGECCEQLERREDPYSNAGRESAWEKWEGPELSGGRESASENWEGLDSSESSQERWEGLKLSAREKWEGLLSCVERKKREWSR